MATGSVNERTKDERRFERTPPDVSVLATVSVVGIMDLCAGKIVAWRGYFYSKLLDWLTQPARY